ncbi:MAG: ABC transporter ATP-binding protein [Candidatus Acidifodinimicrobium sp.]
MNDEILQILDLKKYFIGSKTFLKRKTDYIKAVDGVTFSIRRGETFGLVGESGSGKTTLAQMVARLIEPTDGKIIFENSDITKKKEKELRPLRRNFQIIFQNPLSSLDPRMPVRATLQEPLSILGKDSEDVREAIVQALESVGLNEAFMARYPHELSGGQNQRVCIARALVTRPKFLILDEPTSALDVSIQAQIINLLRRLRRDFGLTYLFITHDLGVVDYIANRVGVMYLGKVVEMGDTAKIFSEPMHPYTQALLSSVPMADVEARRREKIILTGEIPSPRHIPSGCRFRNRCRFAMKVCEEKEPELKSTNDGRLVACHLY